MSVIEKTKIVLEELWDILTILEAIRDHSDEGLSEEEEEHYKAANRAAIALASTELMIQDPRNQIKNMFHGDMEGESEMVYKYTWALRANLADDPHWRFRTLLNKMELDYAALATELDMKHTSLKNQMAPSKPMPRWAKAMLLVEERMKVD